MRATLGIAGEGTVALPPDAAGALGLDTGREVDVIAARGAVAVLAPAQEGRAWFAGSFSALSVAEVVQLAMNSLKTGVLLLAFGSPEERAPAVPGGAGRGRQKAIFFRDGQVVFAASSDRSDRLGALLARQKLVPRDTVEHLSPQVKPDRPLGQVLVDAGVIDAGQVYAAVCAQVREITLGAMLETEGEFAFIEGPTEERNAVKLPERTRDLLLAGLKRIEARDRGEPIAPEPPLAESPAPPPAAKTGAGARPRDIDATSEIEVALEAAGAPSSLEDALAGAAASAPAAADAPRTALSGPFESYRRIFRHVYRPLRDAHPEARERLNSYLEKLPQRQRWLFEGVRFGDGGELDVGRVLANVNQRGEHQGAAARARALEGLENLLAFALFEVKNLLPRAAAEALLREVGRMQVGKA